MAGSRWRHLRAKSGTLGLACVKEGRDGDHTRHWASQKIARNGDVGASITRTCGRCGQGG